MNVITKYQKQKQYAIQHLNICENSHRNDSLNRSRWGVWTVACLTCLLWGLKRGRREWKYARGLSVQEGRWTSVYSVNRSDGAWDFKINFDGNSVHTSSLMNFILVIAKCFAWSTLWSWFSTLLSITLGPHKWLVVPCVVSCLVVLSKYECYTLESTPYLPSTPPFFLYCSILIFCLHSPWMLYKCVEERWIWAPFNLTLTGIGYIGDFYYTIC